MRKWWELRRRENELEEELAAHFRLAVEDRMSRGATREQAESAARREFGNELLVREATRRQWSWFWVERLGAELVLAVRAFRRSRRFFVAAWLCIAVGIGAAVTIFSVLEAVLLRPLPYAAEAELVMMEPVRERRTTRYAELTQSELDAMREVAGVATVAAWRENEEDVSGAEDLPERVLAADTEPELFRVLGVQPLHGRWLTDDDADVNAVVLSHDLWQRRYGGDPDLIGRDIMVGERAHRVVGIMPEQFSFPEGTQLWTRLTPGGFPPHILFYGGAVGRLTDAGALASARAQLDAAVTRLRSTHPSYERTEYAMPTMREHLLGALRRPILVFQGAALLVLLVACANVAALQLARSTARQREYALRAAVGAGRAGLASHVLIECLVLALIGGAGGVALAFAGTRLIARWFPDGVPSYITLGLDGTVLAIASAATVLSALLFGIVPALRASRARASLVLAAGTRGDGASPRSHRITRTLVTAEIAVTVVLAAGAVLLMRSDAEIRRGLGFEAEQLLSVRVPLSYSRYKTPEARVAMYQRVEARLRALPGVEAVTSSFNAAPLDGATAGFMQIRLAGQDLRPGTVQRASVQNVAPEYAATLGVPLLQGRDLAEEDGRGAEEAALVNRTFVDAYLGAAPAVNATLEVSSTGEGWSKPVRIVGVVEDIRHERQPAELPPTLYLRERERTASQTFLIRTRTSDPMSLAPAIRALVNELDPQLVASRIQAQTRVVHRAFWRERLQRNVVAVFAAITLLLAACGMYGVLSYTVTQRTAEFGIRLAMGASGRQLILMVLRQAAVVAGIGISAGVAAALALTRLLEGTLVGVRPSDPVTLAVVAAALLMVALAAAVVPAVRASRLQPLDTLAA